MTECSKYNLVALESMLYIVYIIVKDYLYNFDSLGRRGEGLIYIDSDSLEGIGIYRGREGLFV